MNMPKIRIPYSLIIIYLSLINYGGTIANGVDKSTVKEEKRRLISDALR
jgi:hypothetical protein